MSQFKRPKEQGKTIEECINEDIKIVYGFDKEETNCIQRRIGVMLNRGYRCDFLNVSVDMRKALEIEPYNFYSGIEKLDDKKKNIYVLWNDNTVISSVACYGNEIDDLIVNKSYQNKGIGKQLLLWSINHIRNNNDEPIILHVAKWNEKALKLYLDNGF